MGLVKPYTPELNSTSILELYWYKNFLRGNLKSIIPGYWKKKWKGVAYVKKKKKKLQREVSSGASRLKY